MYAELGVCSVRAPSIHANDAVKIVPGKVVIPSRFDFVKCTTYRNISLQKFLFGL